MAGIIYIPAANAADVLTGAVLDSDAGPGTTSTGLANGTSYKAYALSEASSPFSPVSKSRTYLDGQFSTSASPAVFSPNLTGSTSGDDIFVAVSLRTAATGGTVAVTLGANSATEVYSSDAALSRVKTILYRVTHPGGTPTLSVSVSGTTLSYMHFAAWKVVGASATPITSNRFAGAGVTTPQSLNVTTTTNDLLFVVAGADGANGQTLAVTGAGTADYANSDVTDVYRSVFHSVVLASSEAPRTVSASWTSNAQVAGIAVTV